MRALLLVMGAVAGLQETPPARDPVARLPDRSIDELIARLPAAGEEWIRPAEPNGEWRLVPAAQEFREQIEQGLVLDADQWKRVLLSTGALRLRDRWPVSQPFAVSMRDVGWLPDIEIRLVPRGEGLVEAKVGWMHPTSCGTFLMQQTRAWLYQELGSLPPGRQRLACELTLERGPGPRRRNAGVESGPTAGVVFRGDVAFEVEVVPTLDEAVPPRSSPELDSAVRSCLSLAFDDWSDGRSALLVADPDPLDPRLAHLGLSLEIDVVDGERVVESAVLVPHSYDVLATELSVHEGSGRAFGWQRLNELPDRLEHDAAARAGWKIRVRGRSEHVLGLWAATSRWGGTVELTLDELIERERELAPDGRGPWFYMGTFR